MELYPKQIFYTEENVSRFFLNPYSKVIIDNDGVYLGREDKDTGIQIECSEKELFAQLLNDLIGGLEYDELKERLRAAAYADADDLITTAIQEGVLE